MTYQIISPPPHLRDLVQCFWALESAPGEVTPGEYFLMADNCLEFIFQYGGGFRSYAAESTRVRFQHSMYEKFSVGDKVGLFGVRLYPHAAHHLLGIPAGEVANLVQDFHTFFKQEGRDPHQPLRPADDRRPDRHFGIAASRAPRIRTTPYSGKR